MCVAALTALAMPRAGSNAVVVTERPRPRPDPFVRRGPAKPAVKVSKLGRRIGRNAKARRGMSPLKAPSPSPTRSR
jgi:hypothetical protein